ncbi:hypothetical protein FV242_12230 [Methylobacterium sp. WL64]|jgi:hypothetical protein|uniref:hypothetical protein n=1 Tax=Methylobacterium sp. WL64 TaxID=2603894 RepID=UPI0011C8D236|nr:hypothetical protein [Methylobacterium sp. WL64]TXN03245.1 hypothetical protein FV242_12230 [Methylobacterium sp. WL64]
MIDPKRPETDPAQAEPGERGYENLPVRGTSQGPRSLGASEPGDIGAPRNDEAKRVAEQGDTRSPVERAGHEAFDTAKTDTQRRT